MSKSRLTYTALIVCLVLLAAAALLLFGRNAGLTYADADKYTAGDAGIASSSVENLEVHWTEGRVKVEYRADARVTVSESSPKALSDDDRLRWRLDGSTLKIQYAKPGFRLSSGLEKTLTITLPEGMKLKTAVIEAASADLEIGELEADEIRLSATSGDIQAAARAGKLTVETTSGDQAVVQKGNCEFLKVSSTSGSIALTAEGAKETGVKSTSGNIAAEIADADKAGISSTSGLVSVKIVRAAELKIDTTSGNVTAVLPEEPGFTCETQTASGSFSSDLALVSSGKTYTCGDGSMKCRISTTSGSIRLAGGK